MRIIYILLFCFYTQAYAQKNISAQFFQSNIRPQLSAIISDFYQMISLFPEYPKDVIEILQLSHKLRTYKELLLEGCPHFLNNKCIKGIDSLIKDISFLDHKCLFLNSNLNMSQSLFLDKISGIKISNELQLSSGELLGKLSNASLKIKAQLHTTSPTQEIVKHIDEVITMASLTAVEFIPFHYQGEVRHFYFNFVYPIEQNITKTQSFTFFNQSINSLNLALNLMVQNLTKRNKKTPEGMSPYLNIIHNQWNSILRNYF